MIVDVPTPGEFHTAGVNQLYLAWKITIGAQQALTRIGAAADDREAAGDYWRSVQPELANAYSLIQQAMEMALKGRIAAVSPFLLLGNPADWPGKGATEPLSFGELPTLDASKLVKVHNLLIDPPLDAAFATFWEKVRRDRNRIMHSTSRLTFTAGEVVLAILRAAKTLFADIPWADRLLAQEAGQKYAIFCMDDHVYSEVVGEIGCAIALLTPADALELLGFRRSELVRIRVEDIAPHPRGLSITIPFSKGDQAGVGQSVAILEGRRIEPVRHLRAWIEAAGITGGAVFRRLTPHGRVTDAALSEQSVALVVKKRAAAVGYDPALFAGHSLRAGFLTEAGRTGATLFKMQEHSRHKSIEMLSTYVRDEEAFRNHAAEGFA